MPPTSTLPATVHTFPQLIRWLADEYHDGAVWRIAKEIGVSVPLVNQWHHGVIKSPRTVNLTALADRYDLPFLDVVRLVSGRPPIAGGSAGIAAPALARARSVVSLIRRWWREATGPRLAFA